MNNSIKLYLNKNSEPIPLTCIVFSGGEEHIKIDMATLQKFNDMRDIMIDAKLTSSQSLIQLLLLNDALERTHLITPLTRKTLKIGYMPAARQDRVCEPGEALSLAVYASLINSIKAHQVIIEDPHSDVTSALINNIKVITQEDIVCRKLGAYLKSEQVTLISPDAGALKKIYGTAKKLDLPVIEASKKRDTKTGKVIATYIDLQGNLPEKVIIIDDICDGGRTFIELAKVLKQKGVNTIYLYVTHGIFSQGLSVFDGYIEKIFTHNLWNESLENTEKTQLVNLAPIERF